MQNIEDSRGIPDCGCRLGENGDKSLKPPEFWGRGWGYIPFIAQGYFGDGDNIKFGDGKSPKFIDLRGGDEGAILRDFVHPSHN